MWSCCVALNQVRVELLPPQSSLRIGVIPSDRPDSVTAETLYVVANAAAGVWWLANCIVAAPSTGFDEARRVKGGVRGKPAPGANINEADVVGVGVVQLQHDDLKAWAVFLTVNGASTGVRYYDVTSATPPAGLAFGALCSETVALSFNYGASTFLYKPMETKRRAYVCSCAAAVACVARAHGCAPLALQRREGRRPCCAQ